MSNTKRRHPIDHLLGGVELGDTLLIKKKKCGAHKLEVQVSAVRPKLIEAKFREGVRDFKFDRVLGYGVDNNYMIVAIGGEDIAKYREDEKGWKSPPVRSMGTVKIAEEEPDEEQNLPINDQLAGSAERVARRVFLHFRAGQFDACREIITHAQIAYESEAKLFEHAIAVRGVGMSISIILPQELANPLEKYGIHDIDQLCKIDRDYLIDHVFGVSEKRTDEIIVILDRHGLEHRLTKEYSYAVDDDILSLTAEPETTEIGMELVAAA